MIAILGHRSVYGLSLDKFHEYRIVAITSPSHFEAHAGLFGLLMKGSFDPNVFTVTF